MPVHNMNDDILILLLTLGFVILIVLIFTLYLNGRNQSVSRRVRDIPTPPLTPFPGDIENAIDDFADY